MQAIIPAGRNDCIVINRTAGIIVQHKASAAFGFYYIAVKSQICPGCVHEAVFVSGYHERIVVYLNIIIISAIKSLIIPTKG